MRVPDSNLKMSMEVTRYLLEVCKYLFIVISIGNLGFISNILSM